MEHGPRRGKIPTPNIDRLAKKYLDKDKYPFGQPGEVRVMYEIQPTSVSGG